MQLPATSLIICSRNRPQLLLETVLSVLNGEETPSELLIMDQSSQTHLKLARLTSPRCDVRYIQTKVIGECPARNEGICLARHKLLVFTDDDVLVTRTWFGTLVNTLISAGPRNVVTGRVLPSTPQTPNGFAPSTKTDEQPAVYQGRIWSDELYPMSMALFRSALDEVGGFDERLGAGSPFRGGEDNDLGFRLLEAGYRILYVPDAILYHRAWRKAEDYLPTCWAYGYGQGAYYGKHLNLRDRYMLHRMSRSIAKHLSIFIRQVWWERRQAYGEALYALGIIYGCAKWTLVQWGII